MAVDTQAKKKPVTDEIATTQKDIDIFAGYLTRLVNPDPVLRTEAGGKGIKLYDEVARDAHAGSVLQTRALSVVGKEWNIEPGKSGLKDGRAVVTDQDDVIAAFVQKTLASCNFDQARQELLKAVLYGYRSAEVMWQVSSDGDITIKKIIGKHPRRFCFTTERELKLLTPSNMIEGESVPERKFITFTYGDSDNPYGDGLGRILWWPVWFKKNGIKFWLIFLDKFGQPTPVGKYPPGTGKPEQDKLLDAIELIHTETGIVIPDNMVIDLMEAARTGTVSYKDMCEYMDRSISKAVLGQTASTEGTAGKLGNEQAQDDVRQEIIEADADLLDACLNETLVRWLVDFNFPAVSSYPALETFAGKKPDLKNQSEIDKTLVKEIGLPVSRKYFYETYNIPEPEEGEETIGGAEGGKLYEYNLKYGLIKENEVRAGLGLPPIPGGDVRVSLPELSTETRQAALMAEQSGRALDWPSLIVLENTASFARGAKGRPGTGKRPGVFADAQHGANGEESTANMYAAQLEGALAPHLDGMIDSIKALVLSAGSLEEIRDGILEMADGMDATQIGELMAQAFAAVELAGRYDIMENDR